MTTPLDDPIITITPVLTTATASSGNLDIPASQRRPGDNNRLLKLPAGVHYVSLVWRGPIAAYLQVQSGGDPTSRTALTLLGGPEAAPTMAQVVIAEPGGAIWFRTVRTATAEEVAGGYGNLGVTVHLNPTRQPLD